MLQSFIKYLLLFVAIITICSCNRYIDTTKTKRQISLKPGSFDFYPDSNVLFYDSNVKLKMDDVVLYPKSFKVTLPKKLKWYTFSNSKEFLFFYSKRQVVVIKVDLENQMLLRDTIYSPNEAELSNFISYKLHSTGNKYNIKDIPFDSNRKHMFIEKGAATILLYNIEVENYDSFYENAMSFNFVEKK